MKPAAAATPPAVGSLLSMASCARTPQAVYCGQAKFTHLDERLGGSFDREASALTVISAQMVRIDSLGSRAPRPN